jgi:hypothetical protein
VISYQDPLPRALACNIQVAERLARVLHLLPGNSPLPASPPGQQADGWSCGLWVLQYAEQAMRAQRAEVLMFPASITQISRRLNEFIAKLRPNSGPAHGAMEPAPPTDPLPLTPATVPQPPTTATDSLPPASAQITRSKTLPVHATFEEALEAAQRCTKCRPTKKGSKGCASCMGSWFSELRQKRPGG